MSELLVLENVRKAFRSPDGTELKILDGIDLTLKEGEIISIVGKSGSGKSTLLSVAALLASKDSGRILYSGKDTEMLTKKEVETLRSYSMGFVFQQSLLLEDFSALENVAMPLLIQRRNKAESFRKAAALLDEVGLSERKNYRPALLSGGERQRVAIARAIVASPEVIFADEPTGSLDEKNASEIEALMFSAIRKEGRGMVLVTHNSDFASKADSVYRLSDGRLHAGLF